MTLYFITASDPDYDDEVEGTFTDAIDAALACAREGSRDIGVFEEVDWQVCLTPDERQNLQPPGSSR